MKGIHQNKLTITIFSTHQFFNLLSFLLTLSSYSGHYRSRNNPDTNRKSRKHWRQFATVPLPMLHQGLVSIEQYDIISCSLFLSV